jgi:hypothetical protein
LCGREAVRRNGLLHRLPPPPRVVGAQREAKLSSTHDQPFCCVIPADTQAFAGSTSGSR